MTVGLRILQPDEWAKVAHTTLGPLLPYLAPNDGQIIVVEEGERIVGCWGVLRVTHLEGVWIDPAYRKRLTVARMLRDAALKVARRFGTWAMTGAQTDDVRRLLTKHLRATKVEIETYVVPLEEQTSCQRFHSELRS